MGIRERLAEQGKKITTSGAFVRLVGNDKVMRVATGVMDARSRVREASDRMAEAWSILLNGHALPTIDPALEGEPDVAGKPSVEKAKSNGHASNGANGHAHANGAAHAAATTRPAAGAAGGGATVEVTAAEASLAKDMAARTSLSRIGGRDVFEKCQKFMTADNARAMGMYPFFRPLDFNNGPEAQLDGKKVVMLGSNNYLGLTTHPKVREAAKQAIEKYGTSMTGSRLVNGTMRLHKELEDKLAAFHGKEAGLVFTTGYQVNIATISALLANKRSVAV
ncbi:MAG TPA: aminotransferase class I/II-fold pyridoxal phosphate-dependent enzyme, partial [Minicystis sp.]|nr:aminotransferase class I/II-fold pyridoxal phosphate-dependent enzyme [Minicystis sp.]